MLFYKKETFCGSLVSIYVDYINIKKGETNENFKK